MSSDRQTLKGREKLAPPPPPPLRLMSPVLVDETVSGFGSFAEPRGAVHAIRRSIRSFPMYCKGNVVLIGLGGK